MRVEGGDREGQDEVQKVALWVCKKQRMFVKHKLLSHLDGYKKTTPLSPRWVGLQTMVCKTGLWKTLSWLCLEEASEHQKVLFLWFSFSPFCVPQGRQAVWTPAPLATMPASKSSSGPARAACHSVI